MCHLWSNLQRLTEQLFAAKTYSAAQCSEMTALVAIIYYEMSVKMNFCAADRQLAIWMYSGFAAVIVLIAWVLFIQKAELIDGHFDYNVVFCALFLWRW